MLIFRYLYDNHVSDIDRSAFIGLHSLEYLYVLGSRQKLIYIHLITHVGL